MIEFTQKDLEQLKKKGITKEKVLDQIQTFEEGIPFVSLQKAAIPSEGISLFSDAEQAKLISFFESNRTNLQLLKFVPASGAASRMFKAMFNFLNAFDSTKESLSEYLDRTNDMAVKELAERLQDLPFYEGIMGRIKSKAITHGETVFLFVHEMLADDGHNYGFYPKGLLPFHSYKGQTATPFEEHLKEGALYAKTKGTANLHFTISEQHEAMFNDEYNKVNGRVASNTETIFNVSYSNQKASTDTIAVDMGNQPFRNNDGSMLFRPGGHGALIENLNDQDADVIFIKNIDNVVTQTNLEAVSNSKKMLAGLLLRVQARAFELATQLSQEKITTDLLQSSKRFLEEELNVRFQPNFESLSIDDEVAILKDKLNRPIRVCGMVKNEGEPGGGPFWIKDDHGNVSLQIIESAQVDTSDGQQMEIFKNSTHFNPVDLVCGVRDHKGNKFNLLNFVDAKQGFITGKTQEGKELRALELPGLWNGAMAYWNTIFVEVPLVTFNPVKTVNDLLKPSHQA